MKIEFRMEGLKYENRECKGELSPINFSMEADVQEMVTLIKEEGAMIQGLMRIASDYIQLEKQKEERIREERRNRNKRF